MTSDQDPTGRVLAVDDLAWRRVRRLHSHARPRPGRGGVVIGLAARRQGAVRPADGRITPVARLRIPVVVRFPVDRRAQGQDPDGSPTGGEVVAIRGHGRDLGRSGHPVLGDPFVRLLRSLEPAFEGPLSARRASGPRVAAARPDDPPADDANSQLGRGVGRGLRWRPVLLANTDGSDLDTTPVR